MNLRESTFTALLAAALVAGAAALVQRPSAYGLGSTTPVRIVMADPVGAQDPAQRARSAGGAARSSVDPATRIAPRAPAHEAATTGS